MDRDCGVSDGVDITIRSIRYFRALHRVTDGVHGFLGMLRSFGMWFVNAISDKHR